MGFSFVKVDEEDQRLLKAVISMYSEGSKKRRQG
jgi:hypothetical protein